MIDLRLARADDYEFAKRLYYETMRSTIERLFGWDEVLEDTKFAGLFRLDEMRIITLDGRDVGWIRVNDTTIYLGQFYVSPEVQGRRIGTEILKGLLAQAKSERKDVTLSIVKGNPALRLYKRHGFQFTHEDQYKLYLKLDWASIG